MIKLLKNIDNSLISSHYNLALEGISGASSLDPVYMCVGRTTLMSRTSSTVSMSLSSLHGLLLTH